MMLLWHRIVHSVSRERWPDFVMRGRWVCSCGKVWWL